MNAYEFLDKNIVGQEELKYELALVMEAMKNDQNLSILIRGPSGYGKTYITKIIANYIDHKNSILYLGDEIEEKFNPKYRVQILDEIHEVKNPEFLYPLLDKGNHCFIILTNEYDSLKEPLENRCIVFQLREYSDLDLGILVQETFSKKGINLRNNFCLYIAEKCRGNPRVAKILVKRLSIIFNSTGIPRTVEELDRILSQMRIYKGGMTDLDIRYLEFLSEVDRASLNTIASVLNVPKNIITTEVEPFLMKRKLIQITSKGRIINV